MTDARGLDPTALSGLFWQNSDAIYELDLDGRFTNGNDALSEVTGYTLDELRQLDFRAVIHPDDLERIEAEFALALAGEHRRYQTAVVGKDGRTFTADVTKFPVHDSDGNVISILGVARDLEPLREAMVENDRVTTLLRIASRVSRLAGWSMDVPDGEFSWSPELYAMLDATPADGTPAELSQRLVDPPDLARLEGAMRGAATNGAPFEQLVPVRTLTGRSLVIQVIGEVATSDDGVVTRLHGGFVDVSSAIAEQEEKLRTERRLRATLDQMEDGFAFIARDWSITFLNKAAVATLGISPEETSTRTVWELFPAIETNDVGKLYRATMAGGEPATVRSYSERFGAWFEVSAAATDDGIASVLRDVTDDEERRRQLAEYTHSLESQAALIEATSDAMIVTTLDGRIESWNRGAEQLYGWPREETVGRLAQDIVGVDVTDDLRRQMRENGRWTGELQTADREGKSIVVESRLQVLYDGAGQAERVLRVDIDITEQIAGREQARALESRLQTTFDQISDGVAFLDRDWRVTFVNVAQERNMRLPRSAALGANLWELFPELAETEFGAAYRRTMDERVVSRARNYYPAVGAWFEITAYPTDDGIMAYVQDVTEREAVRQEIEEQHRQLLVQGQLLDAARDAILVRDLDHVVTYWNLAAAELYGWSSEEAIGHSAVDILYPDRHEFEEANQLLLAHGYWSGELRQQRRNGSILIADCRWQLIRDDDGQPSAVFCVNSDVTEARRQQEQSIRAQRMESLGTLAGGIAHDLNNVLTPILMSVQLLRSGETDAGRLGLLDTMDAGVKRGADMIRQVLSFARGIEGERAEISVDDLVAEVVTFCRDTLPKSIVTEVAIDGPLQSVVGDHTQLMQVLINFVTNARDAMPTGGAITIRARNFELAEEYQAVTNLAAPGKYVAIDVEDDGHGIDADTLSKIFEPFFTTKPQGSGTGLGLPTSMAIARSHGGYIQVYSEPGTGSRFQLHLPASVHEVGRPEQPAPSGEMPRGNGERVLVVDDESAIRQIVRQTLAAHGYETVEASNGREAIDLIEAGEVHVDLVLTDMMMPVMDGAATARYLRENHPKIAIVAASGLNANGGVARARDLGVTYFIAKPFTTEALLQTLREALDGH